MHLRMTIVAGRNTVGRSRRQNLIRLYFAVFPALFRIPRLEIPTAAAAAEIVGSIRVHVDEILFTDHRLDNVAQIFRDRVTKAFSN